MSKALLIVCALAVAPVFVLAQNGDEVKKAEMDWAAAVKAGDQAKLGQILGDGLVYTHSTGLVENKAEYLQKLKSGTQKYTQIEYSDMKAQSFGNTGVITANARVAGATAGVPFDNRLRVTHVWVKQGGRWQLVAHQTTKVP